MSGFVLFKTLLAATALVNVDVGRQLFVDDALVETTTLKRGHPWGPTPLMDFC